MGRNVAYLAEMTAVFVAQLAPRLHKPGAIPGHIGEMPIEAALVTARRSQSRSIVSGLMASSARIAWPA
jgi:hypothetical protein